MKDKLFIFKAGKFPVQGDYSVEKVKEIFGNVTDNIKGIFAHTSHWNKLEKEPLELGEFSNFEVDEEGKVYADIEFNEKGLQFKLDNVIKSVSVEIDTVSNKLKKIALLPLGVKPQIAGTEFEEQEMDLIEFELIENKKEFEGGNIVTLEEVKLFMKTAGIGDKIEVMSTIVGSLSEQDTRAARALAWEFAEKTEVEGKDLVEFASKKGIDIEIKEAVKPKTEAEIREEVRLEFEEKEVLGKRIAEKELFLANNKDKIIPALKPLVEFAYEEAQKQENVIVEFSETEKIPMKAKIEKVISEFQAVNKKEVTPKLGEFEEGNELIEAAKEAGRNLNIIGGGI